MRHSLLAATAFAGGTAAAVAGPAPIGDFTLGDLVVSSVTGSTLDSASPITLNELSLGAGGGSASLVGALTLPQSPSGANWAISGEYGSASEGILQDSVNGRYLTIMGYGVNANAFNTAPLSTYGTSALGQTTSLTGGAFTTVPRVVALIGGNGSVDTSTTLTGVFNTNNARSAVTVDGSSFYVSGQGASKTDPTQGVFLANRGATTATGIDNSTDTRAVEIYNGTLYVSRDQNPSGGATRTSPMSAASPAPAVECLRPRPVWSLPTSFRLPRRSPAAATTARSISPRRSQTASTMRASAASSI